MSQNRLASLKHRQAQFERQLSLEQSNRTPDEEAMAFFEAQKHRINDLIRDIEGSSFGRVSIRSAEVDFQEESEHRASA